MASVGLRGNVTYLLEIAWDGSTYVDETARLKRVSVARGKTDDLAQVQTGVCNLTMKETIGRFNPANTSSAIYPYIRRPLRPMRLSLTYSGTRSLFTGYTRRHESDPGRDEREARIDCADAFILLDRVKPTIVSVATTTGGAIGLILDAVGFPGGGSRDLDTGDAITFSADGGVSASQLIGDLLTAERGFFFFSAGGVATYLDRHWQNRSPYTSSQGTIASTMRAIAPGVDLDLVKNRATVTATGGTPQTVSDAASVALYNYADFSPITSDYLSGDSAAAGLAGYVVLKAKDPGPPIRALDLNNGDSTAFLQLTTRELGDRVTVTESIGGTSGDFHIFRVQHDVDWGKGIHRGAWAMQVRDAVQGFLIGISTIGSTTDVITY